MRQRPQGHLGLLDLGASTALVKYVSQYHASEEKQKLRETIASIFVFYLGIGLIISTCLFFLATFSLSVFKLAPDLEVTLRLVKRTPNLSLSNAILPITSDVDTSIS